MGIFNTLNTSASGLTAQRLRLDVIANNIANSTTTRTTEGGPFQRSRTVLRPIDDSLTFKSHLLPNQLEKQVGQGVRVLKVEKDEAAPRMVYDPTHPDAVQSGKYKGYVLYPNVNIVQEMVDMISASRAYEANITAVNAAKGMAMKSLAIGKT
jgi:flagellar basal-body rod protein FlgC